MSRKRVDGIAILDRRVADLYAAYIIDETANFVRERIRLAAAGSAIVTMKGRRGGAIDVARPTD